MKDEFEENPFLDEERAKKIAEELGKPIKNIKTWFYNRRQKGDYKTKVFLEEDMINPKKQTCKQDEDKQKEVKQFSHPTILLDFDIKFEQECRVQKVPDSALRCSYKKYASLAQTLGAKMVKFPVHF